MRHLLCVMAATLSALFSSAQSSKIKPDKYPSLLWEIKSKNSSRPSYLFGTMHVSSKMVFNLSDSFYLAIKAAEIVALETNLGTWQEDFSRYDMDGEGLRTNKGNYRYSYKNFSSPQDYLTINSLKLTSYEKLMEQALYSSPSIINSFLYRSNSEASSDFEEDTYLDLHIFQAGKKLGKKLCGVEDFDGSMQLVKEAYSDAAKEKNRKERSYDYDEDFAYGKLEEAYRTGNLDLLDTINKVNSQSAAFDEKFLYRRNDIQAHSIDSILKTGATLFVGVGAAHLPGNRGVIELLRRAGYKLRPIKMVQRDSRHKDEIEKIRVPVLFSKQTSEDGFYSVHVPGKLFSFGRLYNGADMQQFADMVNGSYYMVTRITTNAAILGNSQAQVERKIDSVLYENIPGKILSKKRLIKNGYNGFEIMARTRRGDYQRYNIFVTPFEVIIFKMSGNGDYIKLGKEAEQFFTSIQLKEYKTDPANAGLKKYSPAQGGFEVQLPHQPLIYAGDNRQYTAYDAASKTAFEVLRTDIHNYGFVEDDSFDLNLMEESFASSEFINKQLNRKQTIVGGYPALDVKYQYKDNSVALVRFLINGPRYYTIIANARTENKGMSNFINSFAIAPFIYGEVKKLTDTSLHFTVLSPVELEKKKKLVMYPQDAYSGSNDDDDSLIDNGTYEDRIIANDATGEKIYISFYKPSPYYYQHGKEEKDDSTEFFKEWIIRHKKTDTLSNKMVVTDYEIGSKKSSRMLKGKVFTKDGTTYKLETELDTLSTTSVFINSFFETFSPVDVSKGVDIKNKKSGLFFNQFFSPDSVEHKRAIKNIGNVILDSTDFASLKKSIEWLSWKEKKYIETKSDFIGKLSSIRHNASADYLAALYYAAGDTLALQYAALETLLQQQTSYAYQTFGAIMQNDPPVLNVEGASNKTYTTKTYRFYNNDVEDDTPGYNDGSFLDNLSDTLQLTAGIYKNLLPLININDYEQAIMNLTGTLIDSSLLSPKEYEAYLPKFILEAKQALKKQFIQEKAKSIEKATDKDEDKKRYDSYSRKDRDYGNNKLSLYATLLLPFWDTNPQVRQIINQLMSSADERLKYSITLLLLRNKRTVPDTMLQHFAALDDYRYELYTDLKKIGRLNRFPVAFKNQQAIARSQLLSIQSYPKPDTIAFVQKVPMQYKNRSGYVYVFKYKEKKEDNSWKLATVGLLPKDETMYEFDEKEKGRRDYKDYDFTDARGTKLTTETTEKEQVDKLLKRLQYSKRKSAVQFYNEGERYRDLDFSHIR